MTFSLSSDRNAALENQYEKPFWHLSRRPRTSATPHNKQRGRELCSHSRAVANSTPSLQTHMCTQTCTASLFHPAVFPTHKAATAAGQQLGNSETAEAGEWDGYEGGSKAQVLKWDLWPSAARRWTWKWGKVRTGGLFIICCVCVCGGVKTMKIMTFLWRHRRTLNPNISPVVSFPCIFNSRRKYFTFSRVLCNSRWYTTGNVYLLEMFSLQHL